jgi:Transmembrane secretion effector
VFSLPKSAQLRRILVAYTINQVGTWFGYFALSLGVYEHTHSVIAVAGMFIAARGLPALLAPALVASAEFSERWGRISRLYLVEAVAATALAGLLWHFWLPGLLLVVAIDGTAALAASALLRASAAHAAAVAIDGGGDGDGDGDLDGVVRSGTSHEDAVAVAQRAANAALNFAFTGSLAVVPVIAGVVVAVAGSPTALLIDAATFLICAALLWGLHSHVEDTGGTSVRARLHAAWSYLSEVPQLRSLLLTEALAVVFFASVEPVEVLYAKQTLAVGDRGFGILVDSWGVGMVLGGVVFARAVRRPLGPMLAGGTLLVGLSYLGFAAAPTLAVACAAALVGGVGNGAQWPALISAVQQLTPKALHGRLMSAVESIGSLCPAIGFALGAAITSLTSPRAAYVAAGVAATAITVLFVRLARMNFHLAQESDTVVVSEVERVPAPTGG